MGKGLTLTGTAPRAVNAKVEEKAVEEKVIADKAVLEKIQQLFPLLWITKKLQYPDRELRPPRYLIFQVKAKKSRSVEKAVKAKKTIIRQKRRRTLVQRRKKYPKTHRREKSVLALPRAMF